MRLVTVMCVWLCAAVASAQAAVQPGAFMLADHDSASAAAAQALTWHAYPDGAAGVTVIPVTCVDGTPRPTCTMPLPLFTPGPHTIALSVSDGVTESALTPPLSFVMAGVQPPVGVSGTLLWNANPAAEQVAYYTITLNGMFVGTQTGTSQALTFLTTGPQTLTVAATNATGVGPSATLVYTVIPPPPPLALPSMPTGVRVTVP